MRRFGSQPSTERTDAAQDKATFDWTRQHTIVRKTLTAGFACAVYAICGGVVWSAYEEFGNQSLLDLAPLVVADQTPLKLLSGVGTQDRTALPGRPDSDRSGATTLAGGERPTPPRRQSAPAVSLDSGEGIEADTLALTAQRAMAPRPIEPLAPIGAPGDRSRQPRRGRHSTSEPPCPWDQPRPRSLTRCRSRAPQRRGRLYLPSSRSTPFRLW